MKSAISTNLMELHPRSPKVSSLLPFPVAVRISLFCDLWGTLKKGKARGDEEGLYLSLKVGIICDLIEKRFYGKWPY